MTAASMTRAAQTVLRSIPHTQNAYSQGKRCKNG